VITILCEKHKIESAKWFEQDKIDYPDSTSRERMGRKLTHLATKEIGSDCPDCGTIGLSKKTGKIEKLESPNDWFLSDIFDRLV
jgi:hypothetical protein